MLVVRCIDGNYSKLDTHTDVEFDNLYKVYEEDWNDDFACVRVYNYETEAPLDVRPMIKYLKERFEIIR